MKWGLHTYPSEYDFVGLTNRIFDTDDLAGLGAATAPSQPLLAFQLDQSTKYHRQFYSSFAERLGPTYRDFIANVATGVLGTREICYQAVPTFRIHLPDNVAVGEFHRDKDYNHQDGEVNFWLPLTPAWDTNTMWLESTADRGDYQPVEVMPGQVFVFDGVNLRHGNKLNTTGATRVSFDFRCMALDRYRDHGLKSVKAGVPMSVGHYFAKL